MLLKNVLTAKIIQNDGTEEPEVAVIKLCLRGTIFVSRLPEGSLILYKTYYGAVNQIVLIMRKFKIFITTVLFAIALLVSSGLSAQYYKASTKSVTRLFGDKGNNSSVIAYIKADTTLDVLVVEEDYLKVIYGEDEGWIPTEKVTLRNTEGEILHVGEQAQKAIQQQQPVDRRQMLLEKYGSKTGKAIYNHKIWKGMKNDMVFDSWGKPLRVDRLIKGSDVQERWIYTNSYMIFDDDILVEWGPVR
ncbi:MAG TPA: hypothetical protein DEQ09_08760 [Bacteroidales bacterium]|nr:hypothetical protein [Bacteroidales bacterium]